MTILKMSFLASILIFLIIITRKTMFQWLPRKTFTVLWSIASFRLLVPFFVSSKFSICTLINILKNRLINTRSVSELKLSVARNAISGTVLNVTTAGDLNKTADIYFLLFKGIWIVGICICISFFLIRHFHWLMEYSVSLPIENEFIEEWKWKHPMRRKVDIRQSDRITTALTYGVFRPVVLLPKTINWGDETQLQYILTHEYAHIRELHILLKWLLVCAVCLHWFNPIVWIMYILANRDIELSCDETVVWILGEDVKYSYALTLIELEEKKSFFGTIANYFSKNPIEERMISIMKIRKKSFIGIFTAFALIICVSLLCTTDTVSEASGNTLFSTQETASEETVPGYGTETLDYSVDFIKSEKTVCLVNGTASEHEVENGQMIVYEDENKTWFLEQGETICIDVAIETVLKDGQTAVIGYIVDDCYTDIFSGKIMQNMSVEFSAPKDGNYTFYLIGASSDTIHIQSLSAL